MTPAPRCFLEQRAVEWSAVRGFAATKQASKKLLNRENDREYK